MLGVVFGLDLCVDFVEVSEECSNESLSRGDVVFEFRVDFFESRHNSANESLSLDRSFFV
jgi:3-dehydroquinate dehydratase